MLLKVFIFAGAVNLSLSLLDLYVVPFFYLFGGYIFA